MKGFISIAAAVCVVIGIGATLEAKVEAPVQLLTVSPVRVTAGISDPQCHDGRGVKVTYPSAGQSQTTSIASTTLPNGETLVAVGSIPIASHWVTRVWAFAPDCTLMPGFGERGWEDLLTPYQVGIDVLQPARHGQVLVGATSAAGSVVGRMWPNGQMDWDFGRNGWQVIPWSTPYFPGQGQITALEEEPSGKLLVADSDSGGCCGFNWVSELSPSGVINRAFGQDGKVAIPRMTEDVVIGKLEVESNGDILAETGGGHMGLWENYPTALSPSGRVLTQFAVRFDRAWRRFDRSYVFTGDLLMTRQGFLMVGTRQDSLVSNVPDPSASGVVASFDNSGRLRPIFGSAPVLRFASPLREGVCAAWRPSGGLLMVGTSVDLEEIDDRQPMTMSIVAFTAAGTIDARYGTNGRASVVLPYRQSAFPDVAVSDSRRDVVLITSNGENNFTLDEFKADD